MVHDVQLLIHVASLTIHQSKRNVGLSTKDEKKKCRNMYYLAINNNNKLLQLL